MSCHTSTAPEIWTAGGLQTWLVLTQYYPPEMGAPQIRLRCFVRELLRHGKQVRVLTGMPNYPAGRIMDRYRGRLFSCEKIDGVPVKRTWVYAATGKSGVARFLNYCTLALTSLPVVLFGQRPDVIFVEAQPLPLGIVALLMKFLRGVRYIYNVPDLQVDVARQLGFIRNKHLLWLAERLEILLSRNAWKVSTVTHRFMDYFESRGIPKNRITFLPNGADTDVLRPSEPSPAYLSEWQLQDKKVFVYAGTHAYYHGLDTLINAAEILKNDPVIRIVMVGDGPERERLRSLARRKQLDNVVFGSAPYEKTTELYSIACASVATLRDLPVAKGMRLSKVFPALSCGVPVIYSGMGEAAELLVQNDCGIATPPENPVALAEAMASLAHNPARRRTLAINGRRFVQKTYSWAAIVESWLQQLDVPEERASYAGQSINVTGAGD